MTTTQPPNSGAFNASAIENEARSKARTYSDINDCCPYPFQSKEGRAFSAAFQEERDWLTKRPAVNAQARS